MLLQTSNAPSHRRDKRRRSLTSVDLFAGAGGLTEGFHQAGFMPLVATDFDVSAATTFRVNFPAVPFILRSISEIPTSEFIQLAGVNSGDLDVLLGGPPCQAFSVYNHQRGFHDERSGLFREYLRVVEGLMPKVVVMENVTGMTSLGDGKAVDEIHKKLSKLGYAVEHMILKAEEYGVPQERRRIFFVGSRIGKVTWPSSTHTDLDLLAKANGVRPYVTVKDAIGDLPKIAMGEGVDELKAYTRKVTCAYQEAMRVGSDGVTNHAAPQLQEINAKRMKHIPQGGSWRDIPAHLLPAGMKRAKTSDHTKRYGRLHPDGLFSTILTKADLHWGAYILPDQDRTLTVRECARAQSFPDRFVFKGSRVEQYRQVGNAVPPLLAKAVAHSVRVMLGHHQEVTECHMTP